MPDGFMLVMGRAGRWVIPSQALLPDREAAIRARDRASQRAAMSGREGNYQIASVSVEDGDD